MSIVPSPNLFSKSVMCHARSTWWLETKSYAPRKPRHRLASLGNPKKKKCSLLFGFARDDFFLKWKGHFSFWGSAFQVFGQCGVASIRTRQKRKNYFLGKRIFRFASANLFLNFVRAEEGSGEESARASFYFFENGLLQK